jgi:hypothetical protein
VAEISNVLTHKGLTVDHQRDRILEIGPYGENRVLHWQSRHGTGGVAPSAPKNGWTVGADPNHRIVNTPRNRAFTNQEYVGDFRKALQGILIFVADWFAGTVCTRHHECFRRSGCEQEVMQRCVGQHQSEFGVQAQ